LLLGSVIAPAFPAPVAFDIPRQRADAALTEFARQAGIPILFPYDLVSARTANALRGRHEPAVALRLLLEGTGLEANAGADGQISVRLAPRAQPAPSGLVSSLQAIERFRPLAPADEPIGEVTVTGSRIERDGMVTPTPVTAIYGAELQAMSPGTLVDALVQLPQFLNNDTPQTQSFATSGAAGASYLNLRGIGSSRTLTLLDGRRIVPTTRTGSIDLALMPKGVLQRIEVVTGGASAAYGSDAVSGVVNLVLDPRGDGLKLRAQAGISELGDAANNEWSASFGSPIGERSHLLVAGEIAHADGIRGYASRPWFDSWAVIGNSDPAGPAEVTVRNAHATGYTYGGLITGGPLAGTQFLPGGVPAPFVAGTRATGTSQSGGSGVDPARDLVWIQPDQTLGNLYGKFETRFASGASAFVQTLFGYSDNHYEKDPPSFWGPWEATITADNAFLPAATRAAMQAAGIASFPLGRVASTDIGAASVHNRSHLMSTTVGFETPLSDRGWELEGYYQYGRNHAELAYKNAVRIDRVYRAFDSVVDPATGRAICRSTLTFPDDRCVPANPFGVGSISREAADYITEGRTEQDQTVAQHVVEMKAQGSLFELPAGPSTVAVGGAWRQESVDAQPHRYPSTLEGEAVRPAALDGYQGLPAAYVGQPNLFERTVYSFVDGSYSVWELFAENDLPLVRGGPGLRRLDLNSALRYAWYSGSGGVLAWKGGIDWSVSREVRLRATRSRDIRAGSLSERFDNTGTGGTVNDRFRAGASAPIIAVRTGNPGVDPERADTLTFGGVYQPEFVTGLSMSVDYYDIRIRDAIASLGVQAIVDRCFAGDADYCPQIVRNGGTGAITSVTNTFQNIAEARSRGIDLELSLRRRISLFGGAEGLALRVFANRTLESSTTTSVDQPTVDRAGQTGLPGGAPRWQTNLTLAYERGPLQLTLQERVISAGTYNATYGRMSIDDNRVGGVAYTNLRASWRFGSDPQSFLVFFNVNNLFDREPPLAADWGFVGSIPTNEGLFDVIGRRYTLGVRLRR
jgi:outer membrane receptor protein involved in Fe transport